MRSPGTTVIYFIEKLLCVSVAIVWQDYGFRKRSAYHGRSLADFSRKCFTLCMCLSAWLNGNP